MTLTANRLTDIAMSNPLNAEIVARLPSLGLSQCMLTAGCIFQAVWNQQSSQPPAWGVNDYDVFYFDEDLSWEAEDEVIKAATSLFQDLGVNVELRNQARVHLWFSERFGHPYAQLHSARQGIDRFLVAATCIGLDIETKEVYAPYGLAELEQGILRINPNYAHPEMFLKKAASYQRRWSWLKVVEP
ncbi:nucleotidyltransferase family protein [Pseudomonas sp. Irchel 3A5]|uniref:nucleotidyltransferase family protein n=1 Tax=Pseudomonas sp. Irchel 3A5 TaxID=2008911 RepID=UPI000BA2DDB7|nr:nucleotidyltransferase family protein [Pseudomonas sp. Irchel 3A5]